MIDLGKRPVAVIGVGVIGASWAALLLARGFVVNLWDPSPDARHALDRYLDSFLPALASSAPDVSKAQLLWCESPEAACDGVGFVQENGPERLDLKRDLFAKIAAAAPADAVLASSTSTLTATDIQSGCAGASRILVGHPFNPPHLVPLVEVVGGAQTNTDVIAHAMEFYRALGKHPIRLQREVRGHIANRLQAALWQEALYLIREGVAEVADVDAAIAQGPGLRWAVIGPLAGLHLSGGDGGIEALFAKPLWSEVERIWTELGKVEVDPALAAQVGTQMNAALPSAKALALARKRDRVVGGLLTLLAQEASDERA